MTKFIQLDQSSDYRGQCVLIKGWVFNVRSSGKIFFIQLRDGYGRIQVIVSRDHVSDESWNNVSQLTMESSVEVEGTIKSDDRSPYGFEMEAAGVTLIHLALDYPIGKKQHGPEFLLDARHLWLRSARQEAIMKIRNEIEFYFRRFFYEKKFRCADSPIFTPNACEGTTDLFEVDYFGTKAYLTQSGQLYQEAASSALGRTYCFGPTFRSEKSKTRRHLTEFWMLEAEASFMNQEENMLLQEEMVMRLIEWVLLKCQNEFKVLERDTSVLSRIQNPFHRLAYVEAVKKLQAMGSDITQGKDFGANDETLLTRDSDRPLFITNYPIDIKPFYMKPDSANPGTALNDDLLAPEGYGEIIGGSQRIDDLRLLEERIAEHHLPKKAFEWYCDLRRYGSVPHSGFGIGLERTVAWICGLHHVRETIPFPRLLNRLTP